jgi:hypothetical protein
MYIDALKPFELTDEQRSRYERARYMTRLLIPEVRVPGHRIERDAEAVAFPRPGLVSLLYGSDLTYTYDDEAETVSEAVRDPLTKEMSVREFGAAVPAALRALTDLEP